MEPDLSSYNLSSYKPVPVKYQLRNAILSCIQSGVDPLGDIQGRGEAKADLLRALLSGANPFLISREGTGKTRLANSIAKLLPPVPSIKGCPYHDDPFWPKEWLCPRCRGVEDPINEFGVEIIDGMDRFSRIQGNEYTNYAKILGLKDIEAIRDGISPTDPRSFTGTGVFRGNRGIVFVDELPSIPTNVQVLFHPILEEGIVVLDEYNLHHPVDIILIATGNPEGFAHVNRVPRPLLDRLEMIHLGMPDEDVERLIVIRERFEPKEDYFRREETRHNHPDMNITSEFSRNRIAVPWWVLDLIVKTVGYTRTCKNFESGASIRGGIKALDHAISSAEMRGARVVRLADATKGLKLALRGRTTIIPDLIGFEEDEGVIFKRIDRVIEDLVRFALTRIADETLNHLAIDPMTLKEAVINGDPGVRLSKRVKEMGEGVGEVDPGSSEWKYALIEFLANILALKGVLSENEVSKRFFVPQVFVDERRRGLKGYK